MTSPRPRQMGQVVSPSSGSAPFALAAAAFFQARNLDVDGQAAHGVFEIDLQVVANIVAALRARAALLGSPAAAEHVAESEHVAQDVGQVGEAGGGIESIAGGRGHALMAEAVIGGAFLGVAQDAIRFGGFLEFLFGFVVARIAVGMKFQRELAVGAFEDRFVAVAADAEDFVIVAFGHAQCFTFSWLTALTLYLSEPGSTATFTMAGRSRRPLKL